MQLSMESGGQNIDLKELKGIMSMDRNSGKRQKELELVNVEGKEPGISSLQAALDLGLR